MSAYEASDWPPRSADGLHGATYEWDGPYTAVRCICGFYRITDTLERAELEYVNHMPAPAVGGYRDHQEGHDA